jgi:2,4-dienoyl-CoA reductase-like NADH-dependent reductase (Old Yellow Enzyme family)
MDPTAAERPPSPADALDEPAPAPPDPFAPAKLGPITLPNRFVKAATFEGMTPANAVSDRLIAFHRAIAAGGTGCTTVAFSAVSRAGRGASEELLLVDDAVPGLRQLTDAVHAEGAAASIQIGHAGPTAAATGYPGMAPSRVFSPAAMKFTRAMTDDDIATVTDDFVAAARRAVEAGFDMIELHLGHGYLLSSFLSPKLNRRTDRWGGSVEARSRFPRHVATAVREQVGDRVAVIAKLNMADGVPGGLWLEDSVAIATMLEADGALDALELTGGSTHANPMYLFRGDAPVAEMAEAMPLPGLLRLGFKLAGPRFLHSYPYEEAFFLPYARQFRAALSMPLILLGGVSTLETVHHAMAEGFEFVAMGRALLREPDLIRTWQAGTRTESLCVHCNKCMPTIYSGTRCVLVPTPAAAGVATAR